MRWKWVGNSDEYWRFHVFGPYYLAEDDKYYWIVHEFDGTWDVKHCYKVGTEWGQWMGGGDHLTGFKTAEEGMFYAEKESVRYREIERRSHVL